MSASWTHVVTRGLIMVANLTLACAGADDQKSVTSRVSGAPAARAEPVEPVRSPEPPAELEVDGGVVGTSTDAAKSVPEDATAAAADDAEAAAEAAAKAAAKGACTVYTNVLYGGEATKVTNGQITIPAGTRAVYEIYADVPAGGRLQWTQYDFDPNTGATVQFGPGVLESGAAGFGPFVPAQVIGPGTPGGVTQVYCEAIDANGASLAGNVATIAW